MNMFIRYFSKLLSWPSFMLFIYTRQLYFLLKSHIYYYFPYFKPLIKTQKTANEILFDKTKKYFLDRVGSYKDLNTNIESVFYDKKKYNEKMKQQNNELEEKWRTSVMIKNTPRGNVIMCYDSFKQGFMYYCDKDLTFDLLNSLAAMYVIQFKCLDFFIDNVYFKENKTPFIDLYQKEEKKKTKEEGKPSKKSLFEENKDVFVKKKLDKSKSKIKFKKDEETEPEKEVFTNKFIKMGRCNNFSFLKKIVKKNENNSFTSSWTSKLNQENELQKNVFNYKDFKNLKNKQC